MYPTDPSLYGATLPQKDLSIPTPFMNPFFGATQPGMPWQGFQNLPWQWNVQPWQNVQRYAPPFFGQGVLPYQPQTFGQGVLPYQPQAFGQGVLPYQAQTFGYGTPYMTPPFSPMGFHPYIQAGMNSPMAWQRYCY